MDVRGKDGGSVATEGEEEGQRRTHQTKEKWEERVRGNLKRTCEGSCDAVRYSIRVFPSVLIKLQLLKQPRTGSHTHTHTEPYSLSHFIP